jgi:tetratricopeptide (TPR) repeat protein
MHESKSDYYTLLQTLKQLHTPEAINFKNLESIAPGAFANSLSPHHSAARLLIDTIVAMNDLSSQSSPRVRRWQAILKMRFLQRMTIEETAMRLSLSRSMAAIEQRHAIMYLLGELRVKLGISGIAESPMAAIPSKHVAEAIGILHKIGDSYATRSDPTSAFDVVKHGMQLSNDIGDAELQCRSNLAMAFFSYWQGNLLVGEQHLDCAMSIANTNRLYSFKQQALAFSSYVASSQCSYASAIELAVLALSEHRSPRLGDALLAHVTLARCLTAFGRADKALIILNTLARSVTQSVTQVDAGTILAVLFPMLDVYLSKADTHASRVLLDDLAPLVSDGNMLNLSAYRSRKGMFSALEGDVSAGVTEFEVSINLAHMANCPWLVAQNTCRLAWLYLALGEYRLSSEAFQKSTEIGETLSAMDISQLSRFGSYLCEKRLFWATSDLSRNLQFILDPLLECGRSVALELTLGQPNLQRLHSDTQARVEFVSSLFPC